MPTRLIGELLVAAGACSAEDIDDAVAWQVDYGGRLGTNLLELGLVTEEALARALGKQYGCEFTHGEIEVNPELCTLVPSSFADRRELVPWKVERNRLKVLCISPNDVGGIDEVSRRLGKPASIVIAPEFRIRKLLREQFGATRAMRALDFGIKPERPKRRKGDDREPDAAPELVDEAAFEDLYNGLIAAKPAPKPAPRNDHAGPMRIQPVGAKIHGEDAKSDSLKLDKRKAFTGPTDIDLGMDLGLGGAPAAPEPLMKITDDMIVGPTADLAPEDDVPGGGEVPHSLNTSWDAASADEVVDTSPLTFGQATALLEGVTNREHIARIVLRFALSQNKRAILLAHQAGVLMGQDAMGDGLDQRLAQRIAVPLVGDSAFRLAVKTRSHFLGPLQKTKGNIRFLGLSGKKIPKTALIVPLLHGQRVSHVLYCDNGHQQQASTDIGELLILAQKLNAAVEQLTEKRKKRAAPSWTP